MTFTARGRDIAKLTRGIGPQLPSHLIAIRQRDIINDSGRPSLAWHRHGVLVVCMSVWGGRCKEQRRNRYRANRHGSHVSFSDLSGNTTAQAEGKIAQKQLQPKWRGRG